MGEVAVTWMVTGKPGMTCRAVPVMVTVVSRAARWAVTWRLSMDPLPAAVRAFDCPFPAVALRAAAALAPSCAAAWAVACAQVSMAHCIVSHRALRTSGNRMLARTEELRPRWSWSGGEVGLHI